VGTEGPRSRRDNRAGSEIRNETDQKANLRVPLVSDVHDALPAADPHDNADHHVIRRSLFEEK
jgi:hypothetical protein